MFRWIVIAAMFTAIACVAGPTPFPSTENAVNPSGGPLEPNSPSDSVVSECEGEGGIWTDGDCSVPPSSDASSPAPSPDVDAGTDSTDEDGTDIGPDGSESDLGPDGTSSPEDATSATD